MNEGDTALGYGLVFVVGLAACQPAFDPPSEVDGLRVLAVRPEPASGAPGVTVELDMLVVDGQTEPEQAQRPLEIAWLMGCHNPPTRLYYGCLPGLRALSRSVGSLDELPEGAVSFGTHAQLAIPEDILSAAPRIESDPLHFGVSYAFFAVCAGQLVVRPGRDDGLPLDCVHPLDGRALGPADFVAGFATVYTYEGATNQNPELTSLELDGVPVPEPACVDAPSCLPSLRRCALKERAKCPTHRVTPRVSAASAETLPGGSEILWASFYATGGELESPTQLVADRSLGFVGDPSGLFRAPATPGLVRLWVTVNDQRGGADYRSFDLRIE